MQKLSKQLLCLSALVSTVNLFGDGTTSKIVPRSQSFNAARQIVGWNNYNWGINRKPQDECYSSFNLIFEYTRTFRDNRLAQALFGNDLICGDCDEGSAIHISGSAVPNRANTDWLAEYFGLPRDFQSIVSFKPSISNYILDLSFYAGLDRWIDGMYFRIHAPFVHTKWNLNAKECITAPGTDYTGSYFQGYFSSVVVPIENMNTSFLNYANGCTPRINNDNTAYEETFCFDYGYCSALGDITWQSLCCSRISPECGCEGQGLTRNGFGEIRFVFGYNFLNDADGDCHIGLGAYVAAPTGTRVGDDDDCNNKGRSLFEPIVGNGKHWELGAQVTAHHIWWRSKYDDKSLGIYVEANMTHLFGTCQTRCFDLCSAGSNSRYMLAEQLQSNHNSSPGLNLNLAFLGGSASDKLGSTVIFPLIFDTLALEFGNEYAPVANLTRRNVTSTINIQGDIAFTLSYQSGGFQWDLGYDFWGRSCEKLEFDNSCSPSLKNWALKGDQRVYGFASIDPYISLAAKLPPTDSQATIHAGSNLSNGVDYTGPNPLAPKNFYADNSLLLAVPDAFFVATTQEGPVAIYTSQPPLFIEESDFNLTGTRGISNKLFTHLNYAWPQCKDSKWTPYVGVGAEVEFGSNGDSCCTNICNTSCTTSTPCCQKLSPCCTNVALSQWGVWLKVGSSYN